MFKTNVQLAFRKINSNKASSLLNIASLMLGLCCVIFITLWAYNEIRTDRFNTNYSKIFFVYAYLGGEGNKQEFDGAPPAVGPALKTEFPEVANTARITEGGLKLLLKSEENRIYTDVTFGDFAIFDIFSFPFVKGGKGSEEASDKIVLSESVAKEFFGDKDAVGQIIRLDNKFDLRVCGVFKDIPRNSSIKIEAMVSGNLLKKYYNSDQALETWYNNSFLTIGLLKNENGLSAVSQKIKNRIQKSLPQSNDYLKTYALKDRYLGKMGNWKDVKIFLTIAILVLLSSIINFINLFTARSEKYIKDAGLRKNFGASRRHLISLFYTDASVLVLLAFVGAMALSGLLVPLFNQYTHNNLHLSQLFEIRLLLIILEMILVTVFISGSYPAIHFSSFPANLAVKGKYSSPKGAGLFRNILVFLQVSVSIGLIVASTTIFRQSKHMQTMDLGFDKEHLMYVSLCGNLKFKTDVLKNELAKNSNILSTSIICNLPQFSGWNSNGWEWEGKNKGFDPLIYMNFVDEDFIKTMGLRIEQGCFINKNSKDEIVINQAFANLIGKKNLVGTRIKSGGNSYLITGVVNNYHIGKLSEADLPMAIFPLQAETRYMAIMKISTSGYKELNKYIQKVCSGLEPNFPVFSGFLSDDYAKLVEHEDNLGHLIALFAIMSILILCVGLFGLILFLTEFKTKEIGVRRVNGASTLSLIMIILKDFIRIEAFAFVITCPIAWYAMNRWLEGYASRVDNDPLSYLLAGGLVMLISLITIGAQTYRAATCNPVDSLRYE